MGGEWRGGAKQGHQHPGKINLGSFLISLAVEKSGEKLREKTKRPMTDDTKAHQQKTENSKEIYMIQEIPQKKSELQAEKEKTENRGKDNSICPFFLNGKTRKSTENKKIRKSPTNEN